MQCSGGPGHIMTRDTLHLISSTVDQFIQDHYFGPNQVFDPKEQLWDDAVFGMTYSNHTGKACQGRFHDGLFRANWRKLPASDFVADQDMPNMVSFHAYKNPSALKQEFERLQAAILLNKDDRSHNMTWIREMTINATSSGEAQ